jgi:hypothetical protein
LSVRAYEARPLEGPSPICCNEEVPTIFRWKGYRFHFYSDEGQEPPHVHVDKGVLPPSSG